MCRDRRRASPIRQSSHIERSRQAGRCDLDRVADADLFRRFDPGPVHVDAAACDGLRRDAARLEQARCPQPLVDPNPIYGQVRSLALLQRRAHSPTRTNQAVVNVAMTVTTSFNAFDPSSFDSPLSLGSIVTGTSSRRNPASATLISASTSGAPLTNVRARSGSAFAFTAYRPLVASPNGRSRTSFIARRSSAVPNRRAPLCRYRYAA